MCIPFLYSTQYLWLWCAAVSEGICSPKFPWKELIEVGITQGIVRCWRERPSGECRTAQCGPGCIRSAPAHATLEWGVVQTHVELSPFGCDGGGTRILPWGSAGGSYTQECRNIQARSKLTSWKYFYRDVQGQFMTASYWQCRGRVLHCNPIQSYLNCKCNQQIGSSWD